MTGEGRGREGYCASWSDMWSDVEWCGVEWSGVEWSGVMWSGVEWSGVEEREREIGREKESERERLNKDQRSQTKNVQTTGSKKVFGLKVG